MFFQLNIITEFHPSVNPPRKPLTSNYIPLRGLQVHGKWGIIGKTEIKEGQFWQIITNMNTNVQNIKLTNIITPTVELNVVVIIITKKKKFL